MCSRQALGAARQIELLQTINACHLLQQNSCYSYVPSTPAIPCFAAANLSPIISPVYVTTLQNEDKTVFTAYKHAEAIRLKGKGGVRWGGC